MRSSEIPRRDSFHFLLVRIAVLLAFAHRLAPCGHGSACSDEDAILAVRGMGRTVPGLYAVELVPTDPRDNPVVAAALEGSADYIVSDDRRDLLPLKAIRLSGHHVIQVARLVTRTGTSGRLAARSWP